MPIYTEALALLKAVEMHLVSEKPSEVEVFSNLKRLFWLPTKFIRIGMREKTKAATMWAFLTYALMIIGSLLIKDADFPKAEATNVVMLVSTIVPLFLVVFALPSVYGNSGVSGANAQFVVQHLSDRGFATAKDIELLKKSVKPYEERSRSRVSALKWLVGLLWACFLYVFAKGTDPSVASASHAMAFALQAAGLLVVVAVAYLLVWGYEAALDKLFRAVEFGCNDFCYLIDRSAAANASSAVNQVHEP